MQQHQTGSVCSDSDVGAAKTRIGTHAIVAATAVVFIFLLAKFKYTLIKWLRFRVYLRLNE